MDLVLPRPGMAPRWGVLPSLRPLRRLSLILRHPWGSRRPAGVSWKPGPAAGLRTEA